MSLLAAHDSQKPASVMMLEIVDAALSGDVRNGSRADRYAVLHCLDLDGQDKWVSQFAVPNYFAENIDRRGAFPVPVALRAINSATRIAINLPGADGKAGCASTRSAQRAWRGGWRVGYGRREPFVQLFANAY